LHGLAGLPTPGGKEYPRPVEPGSQFSEHSQKLELNIRLSFKTEFGIRRSA